MVENTDILIIGGGPAGAITALTVVDQTKDYSIMLCDAKERDKIGKKTCGDALELVKLQYVAERLGIDIFPTEEEISDPVHRMVFKTKKITFPIEEEEKLGFIVDRHKYGQRLISAAEQQGIILKDRMRAVKPLYEEDAVVGAVFNSLKEDKTVEIRAKITIDCSGRNFVVRKNLPDKYFPRISKSFSNEDMVISYREIIQLNDELEDHPYRNGMYLFYNSDLSVPGNTGYFWIFSKGYKRLNCGIGWFLEPKRNESIKAVFRETMDKFYTQDQYEVMEGAGYTVPTRYPLTNAVATGLITAGDAASHVNPLTAEGHGPAIKAGYFAGKVAVDALEHNDISEKYLWQYNQHIVDQFGAEYSRIQIFTEFLKKMEISKLETLVNKVITVEDYINYIEGKRFGILFGVKKLIKLFPNYGILLKLWSLWRKSKRITSIFSKYPKTPEKYPSWKNEFNIIMKTVKNK